MRTVNELKKVLGIPLSKEKTYVDSPDDAPEGANIKQGPKGGYYYESDSGIEGQKTYQDFGVNFELHKKVATMDKDDLEYGIGNFQYEPNLKGEAETRGNKILLGDAFFKLNIAERFHVLLHEEGHIWESKFMKGNKYWEISDNPVFNPKAKEGYYQGILGTYNAHETMAEAYASLINPRTQNQFLKEHPKAAKIIIEHLNITKDSRPEAYKILGIPLSKSKTYIDSPTDAPKHIREQYEL